MVRRIAFINEKGGSGKTTLAANIASHLALHRGFRVLAIDLDPQGQLGKVLGVAPRRARASALSLLVDTVLGRNPANEAPDNSALPITGSRVDRLDVITAGKELGLAPALTGGRADPSGCLQRRLSNLPELRRYDFVVIDAPPSFGLLTLNILRAVAEVVIPVPLTSLGLDGCKQLLGSIEMVQDRYGADLTISMVVPTFWRRTRLASEMLAQLRARFPKELSSVVMGFNVQVDEAQSHGRSVIEYAPRSAGAKMLTALAEELESREPAHEEKLE